MRTSKYSKEFRDSTVQLTLNSEESAAKIAADLDINVKTLYSWIQVYKINHYYFSATCKRMVQLSQQQYDCRCNFRQSRSFISSTRTSWSIYEKTQIYNPKNGRIKNHSDTYDKIMLQKISFSKCPNDFR